MGIVYADITIKNAGDVTNVHRKILKEKDVREVSVRSLVDTGAGSLVINEEICQRLGLNIEGLRGVELADGAKQICKKTEPVRVYWKDRDAICRALVVSNATEVLLGAIPLEEMDLIIHPKRNELVGAHGDEPLTYIK